MSVGAIGVDVAKAWLTLLNDSVDDGLFSLLNLGNETKHSGDSGKQITVAKVVLNGSTASGSTLGFMVVCLFCALVFALAVSSLMIPDDDEKPFPYRSPPQRFQKGWQQEIRGPDVDDGMLSFKRPRQPEQKPIFPIFSVMTEGVRRQAYFPRVYNQNVGYASMTVQNPSPDPSSAASLPYHTGVQQPSFMATVERGSPMPVRIQPAQAQAMPPPVPPAGYNQPVAQFVSQATAALSEAPAVAVEAVSSSTSLFPTAGAGPSLASTGVELHIRGKIEPFKQQTQIDLFTAGEMSSPFLRCHASELVKEGGIMVEVPDNHPIAWLDTTSNCVVSEAEYFTEGQPAVPRPRSVEIRSVEPDRTTNTGYHEQRIAVATEQLHHRGLIKMKLLNKDHSDGPELFQVLHQGPGSLLVTDPDGKEVATLVPEQSYMHSSEGLRTGDSWSSVLRVINLYSSYGGDIVVVVCAVIAACKIGAVEGRQLTYG